jgi:hypothetical protein
MNPAPDAPEIVPVERLKYWDDDGYANLRYFYAQIMKRKGDIQKRSQPKRSPLRSGIGFG